MAKFEKQQSLVTLILLGASAVASASLAVVGATPVQIALFALASLLGCGASVLVLRRHWASLEAFRLRELALREEALREKLSERTRMLQATNHDLEARVRELNVLFSCSRALAGSLEQAELLRAFVEGTRTLLNVDHFVILVHDPRRAALVVQETMGFEGDGPLVGASPAAASLESEVFAKRRLALVANLEFERRPNLIKERTALGGSLLVLPLMVGNRTAGVWLLHRNAPRAFTFDDSGIYHAVGNQLATALENASLYRMTRELATHDELTGLYNRRVLDSRLEMEWERSQRFSSWLGLVMVDVDHFKGFNDEFGHIVGDLVLRHVASLLNANVRKVDLVARYGGEEFCILLPRTSLDEAHHVAESIRLAIENTPLMAGDKVYSVTASFGVVSSQLPVPGLMQLLDLADQALYQAKAEGRNRVAKASSTMIPEGADFHSYTPSSRGPHVLY